MAIDPRRGHRVVFAVEGVAYDHDAQIVGGDAGQAQGGEFRDGVVFALPGAAGEGDERRTPDVERPVLDLIADRPDRKVDGTIDLAEAGATLAGPRHVDDGEQL